LTPLFRSFLQGGFECSTHRLASGKRLDLVHSTQHDRFVEQDYARLKEMGIGTVREGIRWPAMQRGPGRADYSNVVPFLEAARKYEIEIVWDLVHFGWPDFLDIFSPAWVDALGELARGFAEVLKENADPPWFVAPVNEISFFSWGGGDVACLNPFQRNRAAELKRQLVLGFLAAEKVLRSALPGVRIVSPEPVIHIAGRHDVPGDDVEAERYRTSMFQAWDMILGRLDAELGGHGGAIDIIGVNFYDRNQWRNFGETLQPGDPEYRPFREILTEVYERYRLPLFVAETGAEDEKRVGWFRYMWAETLAAAAKGIPVQGFCLYPILNHPGWEDDRHCLNGLWDYASEQGEREIYRPLAAELLAAGNHLREWKHEHSRDAE
jgi:beta-glucosidase/6-phospho-beta-glucosidase/beta-galactosidase